MLCAARFGTARSISDMGNFVNLEQVTDVLALSSPFVNIHELLGPDPYRQVRGNYTLPGRRL